MHLRIFFQRSFITLRIPSQPINVLDLTIHIESALVYQITVDSVIAITLHDGQDIAVVAWLQTYIRGGGGALLRRRLLME